MAPGIVYVLLRAVDQHVKIGRCLDRALTPRLADLRHRYGALTVLHLERVHEPHMVERLAHKALKAGRAFLHAKRLAKKKVRRELVNRYADL